MDLTQGSFKWVGEMLWSTNINLMLLQAVPVAFWPYFGCRRQRGAGRSSRGKPLRSEHPQGSLFPVPCGEGDPPCSMPWDG